MSNLQPAAGTNDRVFTLSFPLQTVPGDYELVISPDILDRFDNVMDQDGDGVGGELVDDRFIGGFTLADTVARFDFGTGSSPIASGYMRITRTDSYDSGIDYRWQLGQVFEIDRVQGDDMTRDVHYTRDGTFALDLPNAEYDVTVTVGDTGQPHEQMGIYLEGVQVDVVDNAVGETITRTHRVSVGDEQLNLRLFDLGGIDPWVMINGLDVVFAGPEPTASADFNGDNRVDGFDFLEWQQGFGIPTPNAIKVDGDADNDQDVDGDDLIVWETQYGMTGAPLTAASTAAQSHNERVAEVVVQRNVRPITGASLVDAALAYWHLELSGAEAGDVLAEEENSTLVEAHGAALLKINIGSTSGRSVIESVNQSSEEGANDGNKSPEEKLADDSFSQSLGRLGSI